MKLSAKPVVFKALFKSNRLTLAEKPVSGLNTAKLTTIEPNKASLNTVNLNVIEPNKSKL